jgi:hypothetical protein
MTGRDVMKLLVARRQSRPSDTTYSLTYVTVREQISTVDDGERVESAIQCWPMGNGPARVTTRMSSSSFVFSSLSVDSRSVIAHSICRSAAQQIDVR